MSAKSSATVDFESLFRQSPALALAMSTDLVICAATNAYLAATMTKREDIMGKYLFDVFPDDPNDPAADGSQNLHASLERVLKSGQADTMAVQKYDIRRPDGTFENRYWSPVNVPILDQHGKISHILHRIEDVTEFMRLRKEQNVHAAADAIKSDIGKMQIDIAQRTKELQSANDQLRLLNEEQNKFFSVSLDMLCISGFDGFFKRVNPAFEMVLGFSAEELCTKSYLEFIHPDDIEITKTEVEKQLKHGQKVLNFENRYLCKDGSYRWLAWKSAPVGNYMYAAARDMTQKRENERKITELNGALLKNNEELEAANRALESFSYSVSHDLRAPLRSMLGFSEILLEEAAEKLNETDRTNLVRIGSSAKRMGELIDGLLNLSRLSRKEISWAPVNLARQVQTLIDDLHTEFPDRQVEAVIPKDAIVYGDAPLLQAVMTNLISNAWKFSSKRASAKIEFGIRKEEDRTVYFVRDNGTGFDMRYSDKLFGPFQRLHSVNEYEGTGIGLATVQRIIQRHGGQIWADSEINEGATFYFTIPLKGPGK